MNTNRQFSYKKVSSVIGPYTASSQYPNSASRQVARSQETPVGYLTQPSESRQPSFNYTDSTFPVAADLVESVPSLLPYGYYDYHTEQTSYQNLISNENQHFTEQNGSLSQLPTVSTTPEESLQVMFDQIENTVLGSSNNNNNNNATSTTSAYQTPAVNTTPTQNRTDSLLNETMEAIASITNVSPATERFVKPSPRPAPVKKMPVHRGKRISREDRGYVRSFSGDETDTGEVDDYSNDRATRDRRNSLSEPSAGEEEVDSPVAATPKRDHGKSKKSKRHHRDRETSVSSNSSVEPSPKRVAKEADHRRKKKSSHRREKSRNDEHRRSITPDRSPSRSPCRSRSVSVAKSVTSVTSVTSKAGSSRTKNTHRASPGAQVQRSTVDKRDTNIRHTVGTNNPKQARHGTPVPPENRHRATPMVERPDTEALNNSLFTTILESKAKRQPPRDADNVSKLTTSTIMTNRPKTQSSTRKTLDSEWLEEKYLMEELRGTELSKQTIGFLVRRCRGSPQAKTKTLIDMIGYTTYARAENTVCSDHRHRIQIDTKDYLLCSDENYRGYTFEDITRNKNLAKESLYMALRRDKCVDREHSLDLVFRAALKDIVGELNSECDMEKDSDLNNPIFISGRYLELKLIHKIYNYYMKHFKMDVIRCLMPSNVDDETCELQKHIRDSGAKLYLRRLLGLYEINPTNFERVVEQKICTPQEMRVWTNARAQRGVNVQIKTHALVVCDKTKKKWNDMAGETKNTPLSYLFVDEYENMSKPFMISHDNFLSAVLQTSELMAWMCFGITTNHDIGTVLMAESFIHGKNEKTTNVPNRLMCWNYPLAAIYRHEQPTVNSGSPLRLSKESYDTFEELIL